MAEEKRTYSVVGTVTIGTDEYRDLLTEKFEAIREKNEYSTKYWNYYSKCSDLEKEIKELNAKLEQLQQYIKANDEQDKFELWIVRSSREG